MSDVVEVAVESLQSSASVSRDLGEAVDDGKVVEGKEEEVGSDGIGKGSEDGVKVHGDVKVEVSSATDLAGYLAWEEDLQMLSCFSDKKEELIESHGAYMKLHPEIRALLADFLQAVFIHKPDDIFKFARDFYKPFHSNAPHEPPFPSSRHTS